MHGTLVVGAGEAGVDLAVALRQAGDTEPIILVGTEQHPPYQRPPLSKSFLAGTAAEESLALRTDDFYRKQAIRVVTGERVVSARLPSPDRRTAGTAVTDTGRTLTFDRLALAVGARPRRLPVPGADLAGVCYLRTIDDARELRERFRTARRVVVIGGGFIGLEVAAVARSAGRPVTLVEAADRLMARSVAPVVSEFYLDAHREHGADIRLGTGVVALHGSDGRVAGVELADGTHVAADIVVVGVGIVPRTELARTLGLRCADGVVVDAVGRTSDPSVVAVGDCTVCPHPLTGAGLVRLESVPHAQSQARAAAGALLALDPPAPSVPWFWSDQYDLKLQIAGLPDGYDQVVVRRAADGRSMSAVYYRAGALLAVNAVNRAADYLAVRRALSTGATIPAERAADAGTPLARLLTDGSAAAART
jgi:3-phenylpropionate/trans-cinnamate dioxygenase ferredoxin reductase subunit